MKKIKMRLTLYRNKRGAWHWRQEVLRGGRQVGGSTEGYYNRGYCFHNMKLATGFDGLGPSLRSREDVFIWEGSFTQRRQWVSA